MSENYAGIIKDLGQEKPVYVPVKYLVQWNLSIVVAYGPQICGSNREVAV